MSGALLTSGSTREFHALGAVGSPVFSAASQLRAAIRRQLGADVANLFAVPKRSEDGSTIDWYAPMPGDVVPWGSATPEERAVAKEQLSAAQALLAEKSVALQAQGDSERQIFGRLLAQATSIPGEEHVYLVGGQPVMTFWGFAQRDAPADRDVISALSVGSPPVPPMETPQPQEVPFDAVAPDEAPPRRRIPWWLWLLLLLLLALLLLWLLRSCGVDETITDAAIEPEPVQEQIQEPDAGADEPADRPLQIVPGRDVVVDDRTDVTTTNQSTGIESPGSESAVGDLDTTLEDSVDADQVQAGDESAETPVDDPESAEQLPAETPAEEPAPEEPPLEDSPPEAEEPLQEPPQEPPQPGEESDPAPEDQGPQPADQPPQPPGPEEEAPLTIPESAVEQGSTEFLNGQWQSETGLQDADTGQPIRLNYEFEDGEGKVKLSRGAGDSKQLCEGPVESTMQDGKLTIQHGSIQCPDGTAYSRSRVECAVGKDGRADCEGVNEDETTYDVEIAR